MLRCIYCTGVYLNDMISYVLLCVAKHMCCHTFLDVREIPEFLIDNSFFLEREVQVILVRAAPQRVLVSSLQMWY